MIEMNSRTRTAGRHARVAALGVTATVLAVGLAACAEAHRGVVKPAEDCSVNYLLEVANDASDRVRVKVTVGEASPPGAFEGGFISLDSGEKRMYVMSWGPTGCDPFPNPNVLVSAFSEIRFYDRSSEDPYRSYYYPIRRDRLHRSSDGTWENLFVKSPDRPFYLELDREDPYLARIVITFVPSAESGSTSAVE